MDPAVKKRATYQDVIDSPAHMVAEIIGGELIEPTRRPRDGGRFVIE